VPERRSRRTLRDAALVLVWMMATTVIAAAAVSVFVGRANWGDGGGSMSDAHLVALLVLMVATVAVAAWLTRMLRRHD
jgi:hypothetical protein